MTIRRQNRWRSFFAAFCLLPVALLYAPLGAAAWSSYAAACCRSDQCPIKEHHHRKSPAPPENRMDCGHEMPGLTACTMSCCQNPDRPAITSVTFVLPPAVRVPTLAASESAFESPKSPGYQLSIAPLSPPPRLSSAAA